MIDKDKINDITPPIPGEKVKPIDLLEFFPRLKVKAIKLSQYNIFSDIYQELEEKVDINNKKKISVKRFYREDCLDLVKKRKNTKPFWFILKQNKERVLFDTINLLSPLKRVARNTLDIRDLETIITWRTYPDIYTLPLAPQQVISKFYRQNQSVIKKWLSKWIVISLTWSTIIISLILLWIWYKNYMQAELTDSYQKMYALKSEKNPAIFYKKAQELKSRFTKLEILFFPANMLGNNFIYTNSNIKTAGNIIHGWKEIANIAVIWGTIWKDFENKTKEVKSIKWNEKLSSLSLLNKMKLTDFLIQEEQNITSLDNGLKNTINYYAQVDNLWDKTLDNKFQDILESLIKLEKYLQFIINNKETLLRLAWDTKPMRYLILNQNKDEIRANWGFPWSVVTVEIYKWSIINYDKKDIYYYDWHLTPYRETPPEWLNIISPNHWLRDANYSPVFLDSVNKINFFYEKAWWWTIDTVIGINQGIVEDLLAKYWPVYLDNIKTNITNKNFSLIMSTLVENKYEKIVSPKDILFKFSENFEKKLIEKRDYLWYFQIFLDNLVAGEISIASRDKEIQNYIDSLDITERWKTDTGNWIFPVFTSISWNKSDRYINRDFKLVAKKWTWCTIDNEFTLRSKHGYNNNTRDQIRKVFDELNIKDSKERDRLIGIEWAWENRQFVRILVPKWSKLTNKYWNSINLDNSDSRYDFFKFYLNTDVWETKEIQFSYSSTPKNCQEQPIFYKQSWLSNYSFNSR